MLRAVRTALLLGCAVCGTGARAQLARDSLSMRVPEAPEVEGMVFVPGGDFIMGSTEDESWSDSDERPQRRIDLPGFYIDQFEVSNIEYRRFIEATGYPTPPSWEGGLYAEDLDFYPVVDVTWWDANAYARWAGKRLPTEVEWEKAARGTDGRRFPWGEKFSEDLANNGDGIEPTTARLEGAGPFGAVNMAGNVAEWTASPYEPYPKLDVALPAELGGKPGGVRRPVVQVVPDAMQERDLATDDKAAGDGVRGPQIKNDDPRLQFFMRQELRDQRPRVYRGGSFNSFARYLRCSNRESAKPGARWLDLGFRCAMDAPGLRPEVTR